MPITVVITDINKAPIYAKEGDAGADLRYNGEFPLLLYPGKRVLVPTGVFLEIPYGYEAQIRPRSGLALNHGITVLNTPGTIDSGFRNEIGVILINHSSDLYTIHPGDKIAQIVFNRIYRATFLEGKLSESERGLGGFGHTDKADE
jgi:dUTP pyrophosphatase